LIRLDRIVAVISAISNRSRSSSLAPMR
jgi:hypothetical protein